MNRIKKIENSTYKDVIENIDMYVEFFLSCGVLAFSRSAFTFEEQGKIMNTFAEKLNWGHVSQMNTEDHSLSIGFFEEEKTKEEILIPWHLEHVMSDNPQIAASWNMIKLTSEKGSGLTGFVHSQDLYNIMDKEWISFLNRCIIIDNKKEFPSRNAIQLHPNTREKIIRVNPNTTDSLLYVDSRTPNEKEILLFNEIKAWVFDNVNYNESIQNWWEWSLYDMLLVDLFSMNHAVKGGFKVGQRIFSRFWVFNEDPEGHKYKSFG